MQHIASHVPFEKEMWGEGDHCCLYFPYQTYYLIEQKEITQ